MVLACDFLQADSLWRILSLAGNIQSLAKNAMVSFLAVGTYSYSAGCRSDFRGSPMIRPATIEDLKPIYYMIERYHKEALDRRGYPVTFDYLKVLSQLYHWLVNESCINFIANHGVILGEIGTTWFGDNSVSRTHVLYVEPQHRNGLLARALLKRFDEEAEKRGALFALWDNWSGMIDGDMLDKFLARCGYSVQGSVYIKDLGGRNHGSVDGVSSTYYSGSRAFVGQDDGRPS